ncbi:MAG: DUF4175 family protein [bacterium]|nr:DUF4175 family protein [bacterium]
MAHAAFLKILAFLDAIAEARKSERRRSAVLAAALSALVAVLLGPAAVVLQPRFGYSAVIYLAVLISLIVLGLLWAVWLWKRTPGRGRIALEVEAVRPDLENRLISSLQLFPRKNALGPDDPTSPALVDALVLETAARVEKMETGAFASGAVSKRLGRVTAVLVLAVIGTLFLAPGVYPKMGYMLANAFDLMPSRISHLYLSASAERVLRGMPILFELRAEGRRPDEANLIIDDGSEKKLNLPMTARGKGQFDLKWRGAKRDVRIQARSGRFQSRWIEVKVVTPPQLAEIRLVYFPPEYTGLPPRSGESRGHIQTHLGTTVLVRARPSKPVRDMVLAIADGWRLPLKKGKEDFWEGVLIVGSPGSYEVQLKDRFGFSNLVPERFRIDIIADTPPEVKVLHPGQDVSADAGDSISVRYSATDDFGLRRLTIEYWQAGQPRRDISLLGRETIQKAVAGEYVFELRSLGLAPGRVLSYRVVAEDTDTVSGPKRTASPVYRIRVRNREQVLTALDGRLRKISDELLDLLADHLERASPFPLPKAKKGKRGANQSAGRKEKPVPLSQKASRILEKVREARALLRPGNPREALASMDLDLLRDLLQDTLRRHLRPQDAANQRAGASPKKKDPAREDATQALERLASMGEDILRQARMDQAVRATDALLQNQRSLLRELENMRRQGANPAEMRRIQEAIARLQREMQKLMEQISKLAQRMPAEFMNQRGMRNAPMQNMMQAFNQIQQQLRAGNYRAAMETLRQLVSQMRQMRAALRGIRRQQRMAQGGGMPMQRRRSELSLIVAEQQLIRNGTVALQDKLIARMKESEKAPLAGLRRALDNALGSVGKQHEKQALITCPPKQKTAGASAEPKEKSAGPKEKKEEKGELVLREEMVARAREMLKGEKWAAFYQELPQLLTVLGSDVCGRKLRPHHLAPIRRAEKRIVDVLRRVQRNANPAEKESLKNLKGRQATVEKQLAGLEERIRRLMMVFPFINPDILRRFGLARKAMDRAEKWLSRGRPISAVPPEEEAIRHLTRGRQSMQQAMQQMAQRRRVGLGTPRQGGAYRSPGRAWWSRGPQAPGMEDANRSGREESGRMGTQFSEVLIPGKDQYKVPREFREEVMEALKGGMPKSLQGEVEDYFERLTR